MNNLNINSYIGKNTGDSISASTWNEVFGNIQTKVNELVAAVNNSSTPSGHTSSGSANHLVVTDLNTNTTSVYTEPTVSLDPGYYEISGILNGQILIDVSSYPNDDSATSIKNIGNTEIRLNGVTIINDNEDGAGIFYKTPENNTGYKGLIITINRDSINYIVSTYSKSAASDQTAALYSMNNMKILGEGYLCCINNGGHGVRASELELIGPKMYIEASHDAIHASEINICDGTFYVSGANDVFGTKVNGEINYFNGAIRAYNIAGDIFDVAGGTLAMYNDVDCNVSITTQAPVFDTAHVYVTNSAADATDYLEDGDPGSLTEIQLNDGYYYITKDYDDDQGNSFPSHVIATGNVNAPIVIGSTSLNKDATVDRKVTVYLKNAKVNSVVYNYEQDNVKIVSVAGTKNVIANTKTSTPQDNTLQSDLLDGIKSENNIKIEVKNDSYLYVTSSVGDGIDGGDVIVQDSKGVLMVMKCGLRGIKGNAVVIGPEASINKSVIESYDTTSVLEGGVVVKNNCSNTTVGLIEVENSAIKDGTGNADIFCRQGSKYTKGSFGTQNESLAGVLIVGSIGATMSIDLDNANNIYYENMIGVYSNTGSVANDCGPTHNSYAAVPYGKAPIIK